MSLAAKIKPFQPSQPAPTLTILEPPSTPAPSSAPREVRLYVIDDERQEYIVIQGRIIDRTPFKQTERTLERVNLMARLWRMLGYVVVRGNIPVCLRMQGDKHRENE